MTLLIVKWKWPGGLHLLDFSKAFDWVTHHRLCEKLSYYGISGPLLLWIKRYLFNRHQRVIIDGSSGYPSVISSSMSQETILAPLLFLCFVSDIPLNVTSNIKLYADDILLYRIYDKLCSWLHPVTERYWQPHQVIQYMATPF